MKERWKAFYKGYYEISNLGRVRRAKFANSMLSRTFPGKVLKVQRDKDGYCVIMARANREYKNYKIHQLVARKFIGPCPDGKEVNHKDLDKSNNKWDNLEYKTHKKNLHHARDNGRVGHQKLRRKDVRNIRRLYSEDGYSYEQLSILYSVTEVTIGNIINHDTW